jgi:hypothetical protein
MTDVLIGRGEKRRCPAKCIIHSLFFLYVFAQRSLERVSILMGSARGGNMHLISMIDGEDASLYRLCEYCWPGSFRELFFYDWMIFPFRHVRMSVCGKRESQSVMFVPYGEVGGRSRVLTKMQMKSEVIALTIALMNPAIKLTSPMIALPIC